MIEIFLISVLGERSLLISIRISCKRVFQLLRIDDSETMAVGTNVRESNPKESSVTSVEVRVLFETLSKTESVGHHLMLTSTQVSQVNKAQ
jgi:hypothetical protein